MRVSAGSNYFLVQLFAAQAREEAADTGEADGKLGAGYHEGYGHDYHHQTYDDAEGEGLAEYKDSEEYGGDGLEGAEDGRRGRADILDGGGGAEKGDGGGEHGKCYNASPEPPAVGRRKGEFAAAGYTASEEE